MYIHETYSTLFTVLVNPRHYTHTLIIHSYFHALLRNESNDDTMTTQWRHNDDTMTTQWRHNDDTMTTQWRHNDDTMTTQWRQKYDKIMRRWWHKLAVTQGGGDKVVVTQGGGDTRWWWHNMENHFCYNIRLFS